MKIYFSLFFFLLYFNLSYAQDSCQSTCGGFRHGLQFQVKSLLELTNFDGYTVSYRCAINKKSGVRIGLFANVSNDEYELTQQVDSVTNTPDNFSKNYELKLGIQYIYSIASYKDFNLIFGIGPFVSYTKDDNKTTSLNIDYISVYEEERKSMGLGLDLIIGVEYNLLENVKLSGEYGLSISKEYYDVDSFRDYKYLDGTSYRLRKEYGEIERFLVQGSGVNLGIAVFF
ncbi:MAG: hypothetical protein C4539_07205 [Ignavibacteriales bacterium]|nr:MAG: hypothetical protein C4539_07205 [Ignavibacteriales bacterium]